jgi:putative ABC transport system substrate-binding protein
MNTQGRGRFYFTRSAGGAGFIYFWAARSGKGATAMKTMNMISRRSFLKAAAAAAVVSALGLTGCGSSGSSAAASSTASSAAGSAAAASEAGQTFKVGIVNYVDHASLNQIVASVESRLDKVGAEKGVTFDYADYYANAQADQSNLNQIGADLVADQVDVIVAVATPTAATMLAAVEDTDIPVVYSAVTDPVSAGFDGEEGITGTSDALNTEAIMNLITAINPDIDTIGLLYDLSQDASTQAIADAKAFCDSKGIKYIEKNGTTTAEVQMAAEALVAAGVKAVFTPTDNTVMTAELSIYETFTDAGVMHFTGADSFALNGAFVGYGVDYVQLGEATADMVVELLCEGKTTADLPYQTFDNGIVTINTETAAALGMDDNTLNMIKEAFKPYCTEIVVVTTQENF